LASNIPFVFAAKPELIMQDKSDTVSKIALSHFGEQALNDDILRRIFGEAATDKQLPSAGHKRLKIFLL
jgi:hypothetical protein